MRPMRVCMLSECYEPVCNGVTTSVKALVHELRARSHHVIVVAPHYGSHRDDSRLVLRLPSLQTRWNRDYPVACPWMPMAPMRLRRLVPDIVHSHGPFFVGVLAWRLARDARAPLISTYHTLYEHYRHYIFFLPDPVVRALLVRWMPRYYNACASVIAPSRVAEESLRRYGVHSPVSIVPTGVPLPNPAEVDGEARKRARERFSIPPDVPMLLSVGRIAREKNLDLVLAAFLRLRDAHPETRLVIAGGGPHLEHYRQTVRAPGYDGQVTLVGPVRHEDLPPIYADADAFVFGSTTETQGLVVAEARAAGTPCVVVNVGGAGETVRHGEDGLVVDPTPEAVSSAVSALLSDDDLRGRMREACLRNAPLWTPQAMADRVESVYREVNEARLVGRRARAG